MFHISITLIHTQYPTLDTWGREAKNVVLQLKPSQVTSRKLSLADHLNLPVASLTLPAINLSTFSQQEKPHHVKPQDSSPETILW